MCERSGGCKHCVKVHEKWQDFIKVDNVISLATVQTTGMKTKGDNQEASEVQDTVLHGSKISAITTEEVAQVNTVEI